MAVENKILYIELQFDNFVKGHRRKHLLKRVTVKALINAWALHICPGVY